MPAPMTPAPRTPMRVGSFAPVPLASLMSSAPKPAARAARAPLPLAAPQVDSAPASRAPPRPPLHRLRLARSRSANSDHLVDVSPAPAGQITQLGTQRP